MLKCGFVAEKRRSGANFVSTYGAVVEIMWLSGIHGVQMNAAALAVLLGYKFVANAVDVNDVILSIRGLTQFSTQAP